jgi:hypothetical protein
MTAQSRTFRLALLTSAAVILASCGSGSDSSSAPAPAPSNVAAMVVDGGPVANGTPQGTINQAYVTVTVCVPGTTNCQSIDHVWVDTGSVGLRLFASSFTSQLPAQSQNSNVVANCIQFVSSSYMWGAMRTGDVKIAGLTATSMPIHIIGDSAVTSTAPTVCSNGGTAITTVGGANGLGANGLLGVGVFQQDCGSGCQNTSPAPQPWYYTCPSGTCSAVNVATGLQNQNVAGLFPTDNNGVLIQMQSLPSGTASTATGSLIFGIGTRGNNGLGSAAVFAANPQNGNIQTSTTYGDLSEPASYVDSGTNFWQFNDSSITACPTTGNDNGFYCPAATVTRTATMLPYTAPGNATNFTYTFSIADISTLTGNAMNNVGGPSVTPCGGSNPMPCTFAWGLPFFYGRNVFVALEGKTINGNTGPFIAASTP